MIVSHEHRFTFLKTRKTAGTSIEVFLAGLAGDDGIVTPIDPPVEGHRPRNHGPSPLAPLSLLRGDAPGAVRRDLRRGRWFFNHMPARLVRARVGRRRWDSYYTFCFERNPWEKTVSFYYFAHRHDPSPPSFREFVMTKKLPSDFGLYSLDGRSVGVDFVGRLEHLDDDLHRVLDDLGIDQRVSLTREKGDSRPAEMTAAALFDDETNARVERAFAREIAAFGYERPEASGSVVEERREPDV
jgi:hypothetical protein